MDSESQQTSQSDLWQALLASLLPSMKATLLTVAVAGLALPQANSTSTSQSEATDSRTDIAIRFSVPVQQPTPTPTAWGSNFRASSALGLDPAATSTLSLDLGAAGIYPIGSIHPGTIATFSGAEPTIIPDIGSLEVTSKEEFINVPELAYFPGVASADATIRTATITVTITPDDALRARLTNGETFDASLIVPMATSAATPTATASVVDGLAPLRSDNISGALAAHVDFGLERSSVGMPVPLFAAFKDGGAISFLHFPVQDATTWRDNTAKRSHDLRVFADLIDSGGVGPLAATAIDSFSSTIVAGASGTLRTTRHVPWLPPEMLEGRFAGDKLQAFLAEALGRVGDDASSPYAQFPRYSAGNIYAYDWPAGVLRTMEFDIGSLPQNGTDIVVFDVPVAADDQALVEFAGRNARDRVVIGYGAANTLPDIPTKPMTLADAINGANPRPNLFREQADAAGFSIFPRSSEQTIRIALKGRADIKGRIHRWESNETPPLAAGSTIGLHDASVAPAANRQLNVDFGVGIDVNPRGESVPHVEIDIELEEAL